MLNGSQTALVALNNSIALDMPQQDIGPDYGDHGGPDAEAEETKNSGPDITSPRSSDCSDD